MQVVIVVDFVARALAVSLHQAKAALLFARHVRAPVVVCDDFHVDVIKGGAIIDHEAPDKRRFVAVPK